MKHIGIDFDDTLMDTRRSIVRLLNKILQKNLVYEEVTEYGVSNLYGYNFEEFQVFFTKYQDELHTIEPYTFLKETLIELRSKYKLSVMTGRPIEWIESANKWIQANQL